MNNLDQEILNYITNNTNNLVKQRCVKAILEKRGYYFYLINRYSDIDKSDESKCLKESIYRLFNGIETAPKCSCGNIIKFNNGYAKWCCAKCRNNDPEVIEKNKIGVSKTLKEVYKEKGDDIKEKRKTSLNKKYGVNVYTPFAIKEIQNKVKSSIKERYGVDNAYRIEKTINNAKDAIRNNSIKLWKERGLDIEYTDHNTVIIKDGCSLHGDVELDIHTFNNRTKAERINVSDLCIKCNPLHSFSGPESIIKKLLDDYNIEYISNDRTIIKPLELDFYIPSKKLAIEFNGIFFHNINSGKPKNYHKTKTELCDKLGIQLIHIWENDWMINKDLIISMLKYKLGIVEKTIYARKCIVKNIDSKTSANFINKNHLQQNINAKYKYGLFYNDELVAVMTFGKLRKMLGTENNNSIVELYRYCVKQNYSVIGGASKLFKYAVEELKENNINEIITYAKRDWSNGNLYNKLGFIFIKYTNPGYFWTDGKGVTFSRYSCRKDLIIKTEEDKNKTETEIMNEKGFMKCFDSGNLKFKYKI